MAKEENIMRLLWVEGKNMKSLAHIASNNRWGFWQKKITTNNIHIKLSTIQIYFTTCMPSIKKKICCNKFSSKVT